MRNHTALHRTCLTLYATLLIITALASSACAATQESTGSSGSSSALTSLLPGDTSRLEVMAVSDILGGAVPEVFTEQFEAAWENYALGDDLMTIYDVDHLVQVLTEEGEFTLISGSQLDFTGISEWLADKETNIEKTPYQGEEIWGNDVLAMVILESDGYIAMGELAPIKELLKVKARGTGSLAQDSGSALRKAYDDAGSGWYVRASESCEEFSESLRACEAYSVAAGQGEEDYLAEIDYRFLFRSEQRAESQALDIEDLFDDMDWDADIEEIGADDTVVEARITGDEEDFDFKWLIYVQRRVLAALPTAVPEATSAPSSRNATRRAAATRDGSADNCTGGKGCNRGPRGDCSTGGRNRGVGALPQRNKFARCYRGRRVSIRVQLDRASRQFRLLLHLLPQRDFRRGH